ncbi:MAG: DUF1343 domain-containing protein [Pirellulales bacterium]|nr:DUF1343 domain-containing protein [Pirellulales bacterium]
MHFLRFFRRRFRPRASLPAVGVIAGVAFFLLPPRGFAAVPQKLSQAAPEEAGMRKATLQKIDRLVSDGLKEDSMPGCVALVARKGKIVWLRAYGDRKQEPSSDSPPNEKETAGQLAANSPREKMTVDTVFDLASLTKPVCTAASVMLLVERGKVRLDDPVAKHLPEFAQNGKEKITVEQLLTHEGGLIADNPMADYRDGPAAAWQRIFALRPAAPPGTKCIYSDMGFIVLGELVHRVSGRSLADFSRQAIFLPLGMNDTGFLPDERLRRRAAPNERRDGRWMQGDVHDPRSYALGGIAGHAGLFSTAEDLAAFAQMLLGGGEYGGVRIFSPTTVADMTSPHGKTSDRRALGWVLQGSYTGNRSPQYSPRSFGHGGFTGTSLWIDPERELTVIFLSNRLHPDGKGVVNPLIARIGTVAVEAIIDSPKKIDETPSPATSFPQNAEWRVLAGIDVLKRDHFAVLKNRRIGLITNHTGVNREGTPTAKLLLDAPGVKLVALFGPEHGLEGKLDQSSIPSGKDPATGLPLFSLYGETRKPTREMLSGIDTLVFDMQDIGTRFYTYLSTMGNAMQAAAEHKLHFVVLDRPNPIGGLVVSGPVLDAGKESFVGFHPIPVRHGMTLGELARMIDAERRWNLDLHVVRAEGWRRGDEYDATGLKWIDPSPNMRSLSAALLYPGVGLLETTNVSVGRGTETPFELIGAPWIDAARLAERLNAANLPGVRFAAAVFTPQASVFQGKQCRGVRIDIADRRTFDSQRTGWEIAAALRALYPAEWKTRNYHRLLGSQKVLDALLAGKSASQIEAVYRDELQQFIERRSKYLLYD